MQISGAKHMSTDDVHARTAQHRSLRRLQHVGSVWTKVEIDETDTFKVHKYVKTDVPFFSTVYFYSLFLHSARALAIGKRFRGGTVRGNAAIAGAAFVGRV